MTQEELEKLLQEGESEVVEFKENLDNEALETISAFANTKGGMLLIGVRDDGTVKGITLGKETLRDWANRIAQATHMNPQISMVDYKGEAIVLIRVLESPMKPVPCRGRYFKRVGKSTRRMTEEDLTRAVLDKVGMTWDEVVEPRATLDDLDPEQLRRFRSLCNQKERRPIPPNEDDRTVLEKLGLLREGELLRAAVLLFGKDPQRFYPSARVKIGRFRSPTLIVDDRLIGGTLFDQVENTMLYFRERLQTRFEFVGEPAREVIWEYPLEALREAITNAVCHRDYLDTGHIQVWWYDDRIVFFNPGGLPPPLSVEQLKGPHPSKPRNRKIAEIFYYAGLIEQWGRGIQKILDECADANLPEPEFEERMGGLWLTFRQDILTEDHLRSLGLNERQIKAVLYVKEKGSITNREYRQVNSVSNKTAYLELNDLVQRGLLVQEGTGKSLRYALSKSNAKVTER
ncbi:TPA: transcriptional regulator [Candidatus Poribacteria bacterium]|nr:transcriptional regulator [Candidatus Poribacteria bacterium]HEX29463.1 transcriptional regulator [Candidatus Poribacteria bacterium]